MCTINNKAELEEKIEEVKKYKAMAEEATSIEKALEHEISSYMEENNLTEEYTDSAKISYKEQERRTLDKKRLEEDLGDLTEYEKVTRFKVLRIRWLMILSRSRAEQSAWTLNIKGAWQNMKLYITYEEPFVNRKFNSNQIKEVYRDMADKAEYPSFDIWLADMLKSGIFTEL